MDRIRKALDLARQERARPSGTGVEPLRPFKDRAAEAGAHRPAQNRPKSTNGPGFASGGRLGATAEPPEAEFLVLLEGVAQGGPAEGKTASGARARIPPPSTRTFSPPAELLETNRILEPSNCGPAASAFRMLRTQILQRMGEHHWRSLAVLSPGNDDGKTTTAINLAISLANDQRHTVLLTEFDLKQPTIAGRLGIVPEMGADDLLRGTASVADCLYRPEGFERLVVLPARAALDHSSEMLAGPRCRDLVVELHDRYPDRLLVFDLPPVLGADDALAFVPLVDCALVVVAEGLTRRDDLLRCMELLRKTPIVGTVLNRATDAVSAYDR